MGAIRERLGIVRSQSDGLVEILDRAVVISLTLSVDEPAVVERACVAGLKPDSLVVVLNGAIEIALLFISEATVVERFRDIGLQTDRLIEVLDGLIIVRLVGIGEAAIDQDLYEIRSRQLARHNERRAAP